MDSSTTSTEKTSPETKEYIKLLLSVLLLTVAADFLLFGNGPGLGTSLFCILIWIGLKINRPPAITGWKDWLLFGLMAASAIQTTIAPSTSNWLVLFALTVFASGHLLHRELSPYWRRALEGLLGLFHTPLVISKLYRELQHQTDSAHTTTLTGAIDGGRRWLKIILPALVITITFLILFSRGNAIMGEEILSLLNNVGNWFSNIEFPSFGRIAFWAGIGFILFALLGKAPRSSFPQWVTDHLPDMPASPTDLSAGIWQTRVILIAVNAIFFASNSVDVIYLWMETELPGDTSFSAFVHQGVYNLIACVVLAAVVLLVSFQQDKKITDAKGQRLLAYVWIGQNFLLISSVLLRLKLYVDAYYLSLARIHVGYFLIIVAIGFILLAIKIFQNRKFTWLVNANLLAVFFLFFTIQFLNEQAFVAKFNCDHVIHSKAKGKVLDMNYLTKLGPSAWPSLRRVADDPPSFGVPASVAKSYLRTATAEEIERLDTSDWKSWQFRRWVSQRALPGFEEAD